jgi:hypothetical protein
VDDLNVHNTFWFEHLKQLNLVWARLGEVNFKLNPNICAFANKHMNFLGHVVSKKRTMPNPLKIRAMVEFPIPMSIMNVCAFLGLINYYRNYIRGMQKLFIPCLN